MLKLQEQPSYKEISGFTRLSVTNVGCLIHKELKPLSGDLHRSEHSAPGTGKPANT